MEIAPVDMTQERVCDAALPRIPTRFALEETDDLEPRELGDEIDSDEDGQRLTGVTATTTVIGCKI
jgi:hypothetical protein